MILIPVKEACRLTSSAEQTIRNWIDEGKLSKHNDEKGKTLIDKRELLLQFPTVISLYNFKGGTAKSSSAILLADFFDKQGIKCLVVDLDAQSNATLAFAKLEDLIVDGKYRLSLYDYFNDHTSLHKIVFKYNENIDILPSRLELCEKTDIDSIELLNLKEDFYTLFKKYSVVIVDCPPSLNALSRLGILLANYILIPFLPEPFSYYGIGNMLNSVKKIIQYNKDFIAYRVFVSIHKSHKTNIREDYINSIKEQLSEKVFENTIPDFIGVVERGTIRKNIFEMYEKDKSIERILLLMKEIDNFLYEEREIKG